MRKKLIKEYDNLIKELMIVSYSERWEEIIEYADDNYNVAIILLKAKLKSKMFSYMNYDENEEEEEIFYSNAYDEACSIGERNRFICFMRDPMIFGAFIKFSLIEKLKNKRR